MQFASQARLRGETSALQNAARRGELRALRRGAFIDQTTWDSLAPLDRYLRKLAAVAGTRSDAVFSGVSAAALHGLPIIGDWDDDVHLVCPSSVGGKKRSGVVEHYRRGDEAIVSVDGFMATSVPQTVVEVARVSSFLIGVTIADAALRVDRFDRQRPLCTADELRGAYEQRLPFPGSRKVRHVLDFAVSAADTPLESLSRVVMWEEGFAMPTLQHRLWLPRSGRWIWLDFAWLEYNAFGESDGNGKYLGSEDLTGVDARNVVIREKNRENEVRALGHRLDRWDWAEARSRRALRAKLLQLGIPIVRKPTHAQHSRRNHTAFEPSGRD
ncbi:hypothetical protein WDJ51_06560 [Rathayibacter sp. YIM 133350]|uniref:hypothetical protein n=1 Tax=Rathayibacter sp. YIM 133350 TaxID=3131992 RepID=UPI00307F4599